MDRAEAARLLEVEMAHLEARTYRDLVRLVGDVDAYELRGAGEVRYQIEVEAHWVEAPGGPLQVLASIDDGSFRGAFSPVSDGFVKSPDTEAASSAGE